ncbi:phosphatase PAP2 family protein [Draconibacterium sp. IB214405]|uniref:phosphatase PAP2 family protein n=1 Tax=Draconibacterium sp. IB214405 TaxID=3097352 RepID=UPI002A11FA9F|nr:phosphatase PAP2 family protein [Draconibacterium sp. IB214405]MDX8339315.1 phosphatase PAP2 family protein [Draconibacterium sp. IB214405]
MIAFILLLSFQGMASDKKNKERISLFTNNGNPGYVFHNDSIHRIDFCYADKQRGFKPFIAPSILITGGTILHFSDWKYDIDQWRWEHFNYTGDLDDYLRFAPIVAVYSLNALGIKGKNNIGNQTAILGKSMLLTTIITKSLKSILDVERPTGEGGSMPSGHTAITFAAAQWMHREYGELSPWYSIGAYACATSVGVMRVAKGGHWASDVLVGAGVGMISTELIYLTHQYKWDSEHLKNLDIFPFKTGEQKGLALIYTF